MRLMIRSKKEESNWQRWYAWRPVMAKDQHGQRVLVWLEPVNRLWQWFGTVQNGQWKYKVRDRSVEDDIGQDRCVWCGSAEMVLNAYNGAAIPCSADPTGQNRHQYRKED